MGSKGRDFVLWLFLLVTATAVAGGASIKKLEAPLFAIQLTLAAVLGYYYLVYKPRAIKESEQKGLKVLVLLPLSRWWANCLIRLSGHKLKQRGLKAFEIHLLPEIPKKDLLPFLKDLAEDLELLQKEMAGCLFLWETSIPVPFKFRKLLRTSSKKGMAFWEKGRWPIPAVPGTCKGIKKDKAHYGAIIAPFKEGI